VNTIIKTLAVEESVCITTKHRNLNKRISRLSAELNFYFRTITSLRPLLNINTLVKVVFGEDAISTLSKVPE
jgi:hypothetical protein